MKRKSGYNVWANMALTQQERDLIGRIKKAEPRAWEDFVEQYGRLIYYSIQRTLELKGVRLPPDTIQEIFHSLFVHLAEDKARRLLRFQGRDHSSLATYIRMVSINYTIDILRRQAKFSFQVDFEEIGEGEFEKSWFEAEKSPEQLNEERQQEEKLQRALSELDRAEQSFLRLYLSGMSPRELARVYKVSVANVYSRYAKLKERLKKSVG